MVWLVLHQWVLLLLAFLLGLLIGWWIWARRGPDEQGIPAGGDPMPSRTPVPLAAGETDAGLSASNSGGDKPALYEEPTEGPADDLKKISGIGPKLEGLLNTTGIWYYRQIRDWTPAQIAWLDEKLQFPGRITRDKWQEQAAILADGNTTEFPNRYEGDSQTDVT